MKKTRIISLFLILSVLFLLSSCHGKMVTPEQENGENVAVSGSVSFTVPESFDENKEYNITFWAKNDSNKYQQAIYKEAIANFEALYPNIKVTLKPYTDYSRIYQDVITNIATKTTPNVCITYPDHIATYMTGDNVVVPISSLIEDEKYGLGGSELHFAGVSENEIIEKFLDEGKIAGTQYALPFMRSTEACYVNVTMLEKLGYTLPETLTWDFVFEVSKKAMEKNPDGTYKANGGNVLIPFIYKSTDNMMIQMLKQKGIPYSTEDGDVLIFNDSTEEILSDIHSAAAIGAFSTFKIKSYPGNYLNQGQCIFAIDSTAGATWMGGDAPNIDNGVDTVDFELAVKTVPQYNPEEPVMISQGPSLCLFYKDDPGEVLASWLFMQYLLTNDVQIAYAKTEGYCPVTSKAQNSPEYVDYLSRSGEDNEDYYSVKISATKLLIDNIDNTFVTPVFNGSASLRNAAGQMIEEVTKSSTRGEKFNSAYFNKLTDKMLNMYHLTNDSDKPMPVGSIILLSVIAVFWVGIITYYLLDFRKKRKNKKIS